MGQRSRDYLQRSGPAMRRAAALVVLAVLAAVPAAEAAVPPTGSAGKVRFMEIATTPFDHYLTDSTNAERQWMRDHYFRMRGYAPFFTDHALDWAPPSSFYRDLYAIYNREGDDGLGLVAAHPEWVLRDAAGNKLFINYNCNGGSCPQYAGDVGSPGFRSWWIGQAREQLDEGYAGIHIDDVNIEMRVSDGNGDSVRPIDPRTGKMMTDRSWSRYIAEFAEQIRSALPAAEISHNPLWWMDHDDQYVRRQTDAADIIEMERGFMDNGIVGGDGKWGFETYLAHVDWLHARGKAVIFEPKALDETSRSFELASYLLVNNGSDIVASSVEGAPDDWWAGWDVDLGAATGERYQWRGLIRRNFENGISFVNQPAAETASVKLPADRGWTRVGGGQVLNLSLGSREGAVVVLTDGEARAHGEARAVRISLKTLRSKVQAGSSIRLTGKARGAKRIKLQVKQSKGKWASVRRARVRGSHKFRVRARPSKAGKLRYRAKARRLRTSRPVRLRVK